MLRDLGTVIPEAELNAVNVAAATACGGADLGFLLDPLQCRYDPTKDSRAVHRRHGQRWSRWYRYDTATCLRAAEAAAIKLVRVHARAPDTHPAHAAAARRPG
jgi:feruloyl esterase